VSIYFSEKKERNELLINNTSAARQSIQQQLHLLAYGNTDGRLDECLAAIASNNIKMSMIIIVELSP